MSSIAQLNARPRALAVPRFLQLSAGDRLLQAVVFLAMILEIVVFIEPAPVDAVIVLCLVAAALSGKLDFSGVGAAALASISLFAVMNLVSLYDAFDPGKAIAYVAVTLYLIGSLLLFAGLVGRYGKPLMIRLIAAYSIAGLISALLGAGGYFHLLPFQDRLLLNGRARGLFKDCNVYGPFFVPMALFALPRLMDLRSAVRQRLWQGVLFAAALLAMLLSFSRACWANFGVAAAVFLTGQFLLAPGRERTRGLAGKAGILLAGTVAVLLLLNVPAVNSMLKVRVNSNRLQDYDRVRFATQSLALEAAETHPFGIGPGQSEAVFDYSTHSMYLRILAENGVFALAALLAFIAATLARCLTSMRHAADPWIREVNLAVFACICGHLVNSFVIDTVHWRHIWFIYALPWVSAPLHRYIRTVPAGNTFGAKYGSTLARV
jgi:hypothetical protein